MQATFDQRRQSRNTFRTAGFSGSRRPHASLWVLSLLIVLGGCDGLTNFSDPGSSVSAENCRIDRDFLVSGGVPKDGIPALTDPVMVSADQATYLVDDSRVIGLHFDGKPTAIPHNILWHHEIVNLNGSDMDLAVTYCPLTGSSMAFDRADLNGAEFGVSGLLFKNNLTMYDRRSGESLWPQMNREAGCGPNAGTALTMFPVVEMTWGGWRELHPDTEVISANTGFSRGYREENYPYGNYEQVDNAGLLFDMPIDERRPPKERLLGIAEGRGGQAFPFGALDNGEPYRVVETTLAGGPAVVLWSRSRRGAMAFRPTSDDRSLSLEAREDGIYDTETSSRWTIDGTAVSGDLEGSQLEPISEAYVAFWFAWAAFQPETALWTGND